MVSVGGGVLVGVAVGTGVLVGISVLVAVGDGVGVKDGVNVTTLVLTIITSWVWIRVLMIITSRVMTIGGLFISITGWRV